MTRFQTYLIAILTAVVAGMLFKFVPDAKDVATGFAAAALLLLGYAKQHSDDAKAIKVANRQTIERDQQAGRSTLATLVAALFASGALLFGLLMSPGCHNTKPDALWGATVDCAKVNPENSAAKSAVINCLTGLVMSDTTACVTGLVVGMKYEDPEVESKVKIRWVIDEVACVTAWVAQQENAKVGTPNEGIRTQPTRDAANKFLVDRNISIRNSYAGAP